MARWWFTLLATTALAACSRVPERSRRSAAAPEVAAGNVAAAEPSRLASGELTDDPSPGGRKPAPPVAGAGRGLPLRAGEEPVAGAAVAGIDGVPSVDAPGTPGPGATPGASSGDPGSAAGPKPDPDEEAATEAPGLDAPPPAGGVAQEVPPPELFPGDGEVTLRRMVFCKGVEEREPVEPTRVFPRTRDGLVWVYIEALNSADAERKLTVTFESADRPGAAAPPVDLSIGTGTPRWRTWARASTWRAPGRYAAVVRDAAGNVLGRGLFDVVESPR